uniref:Uncharacterized protein n=1 Tax=Plectus sambesii TaxID=2011161 RepID=A0A914VY23_9BILA
MNSSPSRAAEGRGDPSVRSRVTSARPLDQPSPARPTAHQCLLPHHCNRAHDGRAYTADNALSLLPTRAEMLQLLVTSRRRARTALARGQTVQAMRAVQSSNRRRLPSVHMANADDGGDGRRADRVRRNGARSG